jgi:hypothetical protein
MWDRGNNVVVLAQKMKEDLDWTAWESHYSERLRTFTDEQEQELGHIVWERMTKHMLVTNAEFKATAIKCWATFETKMSTFACSAGFISDFKKVHGLSSRRSQFKRRSDTDISEIRKWITAVTGYLMDSPRDKIINCDETWWLILPKNLITWGSTGADFVYIRAERGGAEKDRITVPASVKADGTKLPLLFIAQRKTARVEETQIGNSGEH